MTKKLVLPPIPEKMYFTIGETSELCLVKPHVLRYWEQEFSQLRPTKRRGNRRYYQRKDIEMVRRIRELLYDKGYTINGAKKALIQLIRNPVASLEDLLDPAMFETDMLAPVPASAPVAQIDAEIPEPVLADGSAEEASSDRGFVGKLVLDLEGLLADIKEA